MKINHNILIVLWILFSTTNTHAFPMEKNEFTLVFLNTGSNKTPLHKADADKMLQNHLGNFTRLHDLGKLLTAGPLGDNGKIRGIVVLKLSGSTKVKECFLPDLFVQNNYFSLEFYRWLVDGKKLHEANQPFKMKEYTIGIIKKGFNWKKQHFKARANQIEGFGVSLKEFSRSGELAAAGPFENSEKILGAALFRTSDQKKLLLSIQKEPSIRAVEIECELHSQWLAEGLLEEHEIVPDQSSERPELEDIWQE